MQESGTRCRPEFLTNCCEGYKVEEVEGRPFSLIRATGAQSLSLSDRAVSDPRCGDQHQCAGLSGFTFLATSALIIALATSLPATDTVRTDRPNSSVKAGPTL